LALERRIAMFSGMVQGVGFRFTTCRVAGDFAVTGYVSNLPDGSVEVVAEGESKELDGFFEALNSRMRRYIHHTTYSMAAYGDEFGGFNVRL